jgi:ribonuclease G
MSKEMIVSVNGREKKIAILDNGKVTEFYIERGEENSGVAGNVYKGRVMRVLPGMQSAFVDIGLERDAFLYVSDFFDEDEEIERIVTEKGKKTSPEDAKKAANEQIERSRIEREKQMESVQEIVEPIAESGAVVDEDATIVSADEARGGRRDRGKRGRGRHDDTASSDAADTSVEAGEAAGTAEAVDAEKAESSEAVAAGSILDEELDASGFERIADDDLDTGEMFKDAYVQEAIVESVRAIEFSFDDSTAEAEVGSLLADAKGDGNGFERIADEEDPEPQPETKKRGRRKKSDAETAEAPAEEKPKTKRTASKKAATDKTKATRGRKKKEEEPLEDAEASLRESGDIAEMAVRRGGRGKRRGGAKNKMAEALEELDENEIIEGFADLMNEPEPAETAPEEPAAAVEEPAPAVEAPAEEPASGDKEEAAAEDRPEREGRRNKRGRDRDKDRDKDRDRNKGENGKRFERRERPPLPAISDLLREGQEIIVQIAKEPIAKKGARITSHIALPGRFLVYMPTIEHLGVSRKIESGSERGRLRALIQKIRQDPEITSGGFIVRTAGIGIPEDELRNDAKYLVKTWQDAKKRSEKRRSPALIHQDLDLVQRILRDQLSDEFTAIRVDSEEEYLRTVEFINLIYPKMVNRIKLYTRDEPILDYYGVQEEIDKALKPRVWLKSGGYLVINQTEALVAIDVNTGKFVGKGNARLEDTITKTNLEAVDEIARQIRLRDLGGIIVLDLIDMEDRRNRHKVQQALQEALQSDRSPTKVLSFNDFGLIIMTRKRVKQSLERTMCTPCENCEGSGWVKSPTTVCYEILAEARRLSRDVEDLRHTTLRVHPEVAKALRSTERAVMEEIEEYLGNVDITSDRSAHQAQFDFAFV